MSNDFNDEQIKLKKEKSSLSDFIERPIPSEKEVEEFEEIVQNENKKSRIKINDDNVYGFGEPESDDDYDDEVDGAPRKIKVRSANKELSDEENNEAEESRNEEIDESLSEIYQDDKGGMVDVSRLDIKRRRGVVFWFLSFIFLSFIIVASVYGVYNYFNFTRSDATAVSFAIEGEEKVISGEEFYYTLKYDNNTSVAINDTRVEVSFPDNFVYLDSSPLPLAQVENSNASSSTTQIEDKKIKHLSWLVGSVPAYGYGEIKIKGKIIDKEGASSIVLAKATYFPENFSSEFKREKSFSSVVENVGLDISYDFSRSALVGDENDIEIDLNKQEQNYFNKFRLLIEGSDNLSFDVINRESSESEADKIPVITKVRDKVWEISDMKNKDSAIVVRFKVKEKVNDTEDIFIKYEYIENDRSYIFDEKKITVDVMKSDLNLSLIVNGSKNDQAVDFGETLHYSIVYNNKGDAQMKNAVIMVVLESDLLDWTTLDDQNKGREKGNTITWTKNQIMKLASLEQDKEGTIDFSINVLPFRESDLGKKFMISSYAQYSIGNEEDFKESVDNRSNTVVNKINSDLRLEAQVRYFNEDNIPVGTGPLPLRVEEETSFKVYWTLHNNLHELRDAKVEVVLPDYVEWAQKERTSVGNISYDNANNKIVWQIGRLPTSVYKAEAEFSIRLTPQPDDKDKIIVLLPKSSASAYDSETGDSIAAESGVKTSKLEDDEVASVSNDGRVE